MYKGCDGMGHCSYYTYLIEMKYMKPAMIYHTLFSAIYSQTDHYYEGLFRGILR
ncbi:hypothetical protein O3M35_006936 [Rhynocoris fuscipes]|uniref:Uncharacterized protein n=1 Tax=Rhynocoris fuscipes TaxID=488301 RepID=A0AAW1DKJ0_9HEMI